MTETANEGCKPQRSLRMIDNLELQDEMPASIVLSKLTH